MPEASVSVQIRVATMEDEGGVVRLLKEFMAFEKVELLTDEKYRQVFSTVLGRPETMRFIVAEEASGLAGMLTLIFGYSTWKGKPVASIEDVYVVPEARSRGAAKAMLAHAFELARERGCVRVDLLTETDNIPAQALYVKTGFEQVPRIPFTRPLDR